MPSVRQPGTNTLATRARLASWCAEGDLPSDDPALLLSVSRDSGHTKTPSRYASELRSAVFRAIRSPSWWISTRRALVQQRRQLAAQPLFVGCSRTEIRTLLQWGDEVEVPAGVQLLREDTIGSCLLVVIAGQLILTKRKRRMGMIGPGGWTGEVAVLGFGPQPETVVSATDCRLFALAARPLLSFAAGLPAFAPVSFRGSPLARRANGSESSEPKAFPSGAACAFPRPRVLGLGLSGSACTPRPPDRIRDRPPAVAPPRSATARNPFVVRPGVP